MVAGSLLGAPVGIVIAGVMAGILIRIVASTSRCPIDIDTRPGTKSQRSIR
jgi:hypothetical protein